MNSNYAPQLLDTPPVAFEQHIETQQGDDAAAEQNEQFHDDGIYEPSPAITAMSIEHKMIIDQHEAASTSVESALVPVRIQEQQLAVPNAVPEPAIAATGLAAQLRDNLHTLGTAENHHYIAQGHNDVATNIANGFKDAAHIGHTLFFGMRGDSLGQFLTKYK